MIRIGTVAKVVGTQNVNYTNKNGRAVVGTCIHVVYHDDRVSGLCAENFYVSSQIMDCSGVFPDDEIKILGYDQYKNPSVFTVESKNHK
jgi:hypothetical protein